MTKEEGYQDRKIKVKKWIEDSMKMIEKNGWQTPEYEEYKRKYNTPDIQIVQGKVYESLQQILDDLYIVLATNGSIPGLENVCNNIQVTIPTKKIESIEKL